MLERDPRTTGTSEGARLLDVLYRLTRDRGASSTPQPLISVGRTEHPPPLRGPHASLDSNDRQIGFP